MDKTIRIRFVDFYHGFQLSNFWLYKWLESRGYTIDQISYPDYIVFSGFGDEHLQYNDCVKIFWTGECQTPDFNFTDYAIGFDLLSFSDRYFRYPLSMAYESAWERMTHKHEHVDYLLAKKTDFCSFVYSNGRAAEARVIFFHALDKVRHIHSGGKLLNNTGGRVEDKLAFEQAHRFSIAFENTQYPGYTTEKLIEAFAAGCVPIYFGDPEIEQFFNPKSFIHIRDINDIDTTIQKIIAIDNDPDLYRQYLSTPALLDSTLKEKTLAQLDAFMLHIFSQDKEQAKRFSRNYWGNRMIQERRRQVRSYHRSAYYIVRKCYMRYLYPIARRNAWLWTIVQKLTK